MRKQTEGSKLKTIRESELKRRDTAKLRTLAAGIKHARAARALNLRQIQNLCRHGRDNVRRRIVQLRAETLDQLRGQVAELRRAERDACDADKAFARAELGKRIDGARLELLEARRSF